MEPNGTHFCNGVGRNENLSLKQLIPHLLRMYQIEMVAVFMHSCFLWRVFEMFKVVMWRSCEGLGLAKRILHSYSTTTPLSLVTWRPIIKQRFSTRTKELESRIFKVK